MISYVRLVWDSDRIELIKVSILFSNHDHSSDVVFDVATGFVECDLVAKADSLVY